MMYLEMNCHGAPASRDPRASCLVQLLVPPSEADPLPVFLSGHASVFDVQGRLLDAAVEVLKIFTHGFFAVLAQQ